jgi:hypothetical protein
MALDMLKSLKSNPKYAYIPTVVLSGAINPEIV